MHAPHVCPQVPHQCDMSFESVWMKQLSHDVFVCPNVPYGALDVASMKNVGWIVSLKKEILSHLLEKLLVFPPQKVVSHIACFHWAVICQCPIAKSFQLSCFFTLNWFECCVQCLALLFSNGNLPLFACSHSQLSQVWVAANKHPCWWLS